MMEKVDALIRNLLWMPVAVPVAFILWLVVVYVWLVILNFRSRRIEPALIDVLKDEQVTVARAQCILREAGVYEFKDAIKSSLNRLYRDGCAISDPDPNVPESFHDGDNRSRRWRLTRYYFAQEAESEAENAMPPGSSHTSTAQ